MHLRRALLLFAIVLGLAAIVTTVSQPPGRDEPRRAAPAPSAPTARPRIDRPGPKPIRFSATARAGRAKLAAGRPAVVTVRVEQPGQVDIPGLGLTAAADRETPARFDVLTDKADRYRVQFTPAATSAGDRVGTLVVGP
jgi:hypothetical protein